MCYQPEDDFELTESDRGALSKSLPKLQPGEVPWKVVKIDNYGREGPGFDDVVCESNIAEDMAINIAAYMNQSVSSTGPDYYVARPMSATDQKFEP